MNVYIVNLNETFFWVAAEHPFEAMMHILEKEEFNELDEENKLSSNFIHEHDYDNHEFNDNREDAPEESKITLRQIMQMHNHLQSLTYPCVIAGESDE